MQVRVPAVKPSFSEKLVFTKRPQFSGKISCRWDLPADLRSAGPIRIACLLTAWYKVAGVPQTGQAANEGFPSTV
jgi:hypothetical protein